MNKNLPFTTKTKMADVIHLDYKLIPIIGCFGIEYGFGNKTVVEVCRDNDINVWSFNISLMQNHHFLLLPVMVISSNFESF
jgi:regulator of cell morphogenesis and NO signaling